MGDGNISLLESCNREPCTCKCKKVIGANVVRLLQYLSSLAYDSITTLNVFFSPTVSFMYRFLFLVDAFISVQCMNKPFRSFSAPQRQCDRTVLVGKVGSAQVQPGARAADGEEVGRLAAVPSHRVHYGAGHGDLGQQLTLEAALI